MRAILLDACVPQWLRNEFGAAAVTTAHYAGLDQLSDTDLLDAIEGRFDVLVTLDRNLSYQQKISGRLIAVVVMRVQAQTPTAFRSLMPSVRRAIDDAKPGEVIVAGP